MKYIKKSSSKNIIKVIVEKNRNSMRGEKQTIACNVDKTIFNIDVDRENVGNHRKRVDKIPNENV